jgi:type II secretory pathway pseudopilin PulG
MPLLLSVRIPGRHTDRAVGVVVVVLILAVVAAGIWWSWNRKKQRRVALAGFAAQYQMQYTQDDPYDLLGYPFHLLREGDGRGCENVLAGAWQGLPMREADYWYYTESTDSKGNRNRSYHYFSIVIAVLAVDAPGVTVDKENLLTKLADHLGFHDIDFESEDFNREFQVKARDKEFAYQLIDARMIRWLLSTGGTFGFDLQGSNLLVHSKRLSPTGLVPLFGTAKGFSDHIPNLVWTEYGTKATGVAPSATAVDAQPRPDNEERSTP